LTEVNREKTKVFTTELREHRPHCWRAHPKSARTTELYRQKTKQADCKYLSKWFNRRRMQFSTN